MKNNEFYKCLRANCEQYSSLACVTSFWGTKLYLRKFTSFLLRCQVKHFLYIALNAFS